MQVLKEMYKKITCLFCSLLLQGLQQALQVGRLLSTQGDEGHDQHGSSASCNEAPEHEDLSNSALPSTGRGTVHQVTPTQHPWLHQALGLQRAGMLCFNSGFDRGERQKLCLLTVGLMGSMGR